MAEFFKMLITSELKTAAAHRNGEYRHEGSFAGMHALLLIPIMLVLGGCGQGAAPEGAATGADPGAAAATPGVVALTDPALKYLTVEPVGASAFSSAGAVPARVAIRPQALASLGSPVTGRIVSILVHPGERVSAGTPLVKIQSADAAALRATLEQATARAASAEEILKRNNEMVAKGVGLEFERFEAETRAKEARAELERARRPNVLLGAGDGDFVNLRAPNAGVVMSIKTSVGAMVAPGGDALVEVADPTRLWVVADVAETDAHTVVAGERVNVLVPSVGRKIEGIIDGIGSQVDPETRRLPIYVNLKGGIEGLTPGMQAELRFMNTSASVLTLPAEAVLIKNGKQRFVYVQRPDNRFEIREVHTGGAYAGRVAIVDGLKAGEKVVVKGALLLDSEADQLL